MDQLTVTPLEAPKETGLSNNRKWNFSEKALFWAGILLPILVLWLVPPGVRQETLTFFSVLFFLIGTMGVILLRAMACLYGQHNMLRSYAYLSSGPVLGQLERLTYTVALLANLELFLVLWIGLKTFPVWAERKFKDNPHSWAISLAGNLMNILGAASAVALIRKGAPCISKFLRGFAG